MEKNDIKKLGIPNVCFSLSDLDYEREIVFAEQRVKVGFDDSETWSLRDTIANFIIPRLERYIEITNITTIQNNEEITDINNFLKAMKLTARDGGSFILTEEEQEIFNKGINVFPKIFLGLWW